MFKNCEEFIKNPHAYLTAKAWSVYDMDTKKEICSHNSSQTLQLASLTKIMNFYVCYQAIYELNLIEKFKTIQRQTDENNKQSLNKSEGSELEETLKNIYFYCTQNTKRGGTTAKLVEGMYVSIYDLFYGLLLPSGNDAAYVLGENFGTLLLLKENNETTQLDLLFQDKEKWKSVVLDNVLQRNPIQKFLDQMNIIAKKIGLSNSFYANTNGLYNKDNVSCTKDSGYLSCLAMEIELFQKVVNTQQYDVQIMTDFSRTVQLRWINTNKLLGNQGWFGIKTGITQAAGPCMSCCRKVYDSQQRKYRNICVIVANCGSVLRRWQECYMLSDYALEYEKSIRENKIQSNLIKFSISISIFGFLVSYFIKKQ